MLLIKHWLYISNKLFWAYVIERPWVWACKLETWAREVKKNKYLNELRARARTITYYSSSSSSQICKT